MVKQSTVTFEEKKAPMDGKLQSPPRSLFTINVKLIPLKLLIFFFYGGMAGLYPFLTLHMKALGLTITETAVIYALLPLLCAIGPLSAGWAADRLGNCKIILVISIILNIILHTMMYVGVPLYSINYVPANFTTRSIDLSLPCRNQSEWSLPEFLNSPDANQVPCVNITVPSQKDFISNFTCSSTCRTSDDVSGSKLVCLRQSGCIPIQDLYLTYGFLNSSAENATVTPAKDPKHAECLTANASSCHVNCSLAESMPVQCLRQVETGNRAKTFWLYFIFRVLATSALAAVLPLVDAAMIQMTHEHNGNIGLQRMYTLVAMCVWPPLAGVMIDNLGYAPAFYLYDALHGIATILAIVMSLNVKLPAKDIWSNVFTLLKNPRVVVFIFVVFYIGTAFGILDSFLFWFMEEDLKSPKWLLGITNTVGGVFGIPVVASATYIIQRTGHTNILIFSMFIFGIRYIGYSYVYNAYLILPLEALEAFSNGLMWVTATIYTSKIAGPSYLATLQGIVGGMHYGLGRGAGALMGGLMIKNIGARQTWRIFAYVSFSCATLYACLQYFWLRKVKLPGQEVNRYKGPEAIKSMEIGTGERELKPMNEEDEEMLNEVALLNVYRATSSVDVAIAGSMLNLRSDDHSQLTHRNRKADDDQLEDEHVDDYDEQQFTPWDKTVPSGLRRDM